MIFFLAIKAQEFNEQKFYKLECVYETKILHDITTFMFYYEFYYI